jgi:hypothetical protein
VLAERGRDGQADVSAQGGEVAGVLVSCLVLPLELADAAELQVDLVLGGEGLVRDQGVRAGVDFGPDRPPAGKAEVYEHVGRVRPSSCMPVATGVPWAARLARDPSSSMETALAW